MISEVGEMQPTKPAPPARERSFEEQKRAISLGKRSPYPAAPSTFEGFWSLGYGSRLLPIVPPNAPISERSSLFKRIGTAQDGRGKTPGIRGRDERWFGFNWIDHKTDEHDLRRWQEMAAGIGIRTGDGLVAIDVDTLDPKLARIVEDKVSKFFVRLPVRFGRTPKRLYLARVSEPMRYSRVEFGELNEKGKPKERVELLTEGRQFVASGVHPVTGKPYFWPDGLPRFNELQAHSSIFFRSFMEELRSALPNAAPIVSEGSTTTVDQASLRGDLEKVRRAVSLIPNTSEHFPSRESYLHIGYSIKAALPDEPDEAFRIYSDWCERWEDGTNEPEIVEADWRRMRGPYRRGANWLFELAEKHSPENFSRAEKFFAPLSDDERAASASDEAVAKLKATPYSFPEPNKIPRRQWLYGDHYIRGFASMTVAPGGVGKSSLTIVEALAMASGKPLLGVEPKGQFRVWLWNGEDPRDELERRIAAAMMHYGLSPDDIDDRLLVDTGVEQEMVLARSGRDGAHIIDPMNMAIVQSIEARKIDVMIADPFVSTHRVPENDNNAQDIVVKQWGKIATLKQISVELVHHVRKARGAEVTVDDTRGGSSIVDAARAVRALTRMTEIEARRLGIREYWRYFRFGGVPKSNMAPAAASPASSADWFTLQSEALGNGEGSGADAVLSGDKVGVVTKARIEDMAEPDNPDNMTEVLRLIDEGDWRADVRSGDAWVGHAVARVYGLDAGNTDDRTRINGLLRQWRQDKLIYNEAKTDKSRHVRQFVRVSKGATVAAATVANVFD